MHAVQLQEQEIIFSLNKARFSQMSMGLKYYDLDPSVFAILYLK